MIKPINKGILLEELNEDKTTSSGIIVKEKTLKTYREGKVLATTVDCVKVGDRVLFNAYGPNRVNLGTPALYIAKECDILAIIE